MTTPRPRRDYLEDALAVSTVGVVTAYTYVWWIRWLWQALRGATGVWV